MVFGGQEGEDKRMVKLDFDFSIIPFRSIYKKSTHSLLDAWPFHLVHIWFITSKRPKGFVK